MMIGSRSGRLANTDNQEIAPIRWMGCIIAVYDFTVPRETGRKGRKVLVRLRARNRRGSRSRRGGRKRRALAGAAPETTKPRVSNTRVVGKSSKRRFEHKQNYSRTLVTYYAALSEKRDALRTKVKNLVPSMTLDVDVYYDRLDGMKKALSRLRRSWFKLARLSGDPPGFIELRFRVLVLGLDEFSRSQLSKLGPVSRVKLRNDWLGELVPETVVTPPKESENPLQRKVIQCPNCLAESPSKICRRCGADKLNPGRNPVKGGFGHKQLPRGDGRALQVGVFDGPAVLYVPPVKSSESTPAKVTSSPKRGRKLPVRPSSKK